MSPPHRGVPDEATLAALAGAVFDAATSAGLCVVVLTELEKPSPRLVYVGESITRVSGYTPDELATKTAADLIPEDDLVRARERFQRSADGTGALGTLELSILHKEGERVPVDVTVSRTQFQGEPAMVVFLRDNRERLQADLALRSSEARFRQLVESAPDAICVSRERKVLYANPAFVSLAGYEHAEEVAGKSLADMVHEEERQVVTERLKRVDAGTPMRTTQEYRVRRPDGRKVTAEFFSMPIEFEGATAALSFGRDVTYRKRLHEQLVQSARMAALGLVAAGVAHEINNPLAYVLLNLGFLARELPVLLPDPKSRERILGMLEAVREGTDRVAVIARDMRSLAREGGTGPADLRAVIDSCLNILGGELRQRARVVRDYGDVPSVYASPERLGQLFLNLISNAAQALPTSAADVNEVSIVVRMGAREQVVVEIRDTGVGIPPELLERIFDPFFTTKPTGVGTGLGLSICQGIVASLHGEISVESTPGKGTTFRVSLPSEAARELVVRKTSEPPPLSAPRSSPVPGAQPRLLIIDDESALAEALQEVLRDRYTITIVADGAAALELLLAGSTYEVILCDLLMPGLTGMDLHARVKKARPRLASRIIFMMGAPLMPAVAAFFEGVSNPRLHKPIDLATLDALLEGMQRIG